MRKFLVTKRVTVDTLYEVEADNVKEAARRVENNEVPDVGGQIIDAFVFSVEDDRGEMVYHEEIN